MGCINLTAITHKVYYVLWQSILEIFVNLKDFSKISYHHYSTISEKGGDNLADGVNNDLKTSNTSHNFHKSQHTQHEKYIQCHATLPLCYAKGWKHMNYTNAHLHPYTWQNYVVYGKVYKLINKMFSLCFINFHSIITERIESKDC